MIAMWAIAIGMRTFALFFVVLAIRAVGDAEILLPAFFAAAFWLVANRLESTPVVGE
jgi:hypothetical protein